MPVYVSLLRGVNVGGYRKISMDTLRKLCLDLGFERIQTYIQSGNVVFWSNEKDATAVARRLQNAIEKSVGFAPEVILRTRAELEVVTARNPFAGRKDIPPNKLLVTFFDHEPEPEASAGVNAMNLAPEEFRVLGRELYVYFPEGAGRSKFPAAAINKRLNVCGTARNWNSVLKLLEMAVGTEASA